MAERTKINKVYVVGTIQEVDTTIRTSASGKTYISGKVVVKSVVNNVESLIDMKVLAFEKTKTGADNQMYITYTKLESYLNKKVKISGEFREGSMVDQAAGSIRHFNEIYLKFVNAAKADDMDCATFEYSGFVVKSLYERKNKNDELLGYRIEVAQSNYNDTNISIIRFDVHKDDINIANVIESNYLVGSTVSFNGNITYISRTETRVEEVAFGDPIVKTMVMSDKCFRITGGKEPFGDEDPATYPASEIRTFIEAYKAADVDRLAAAASVEEEAPAASNPLGGITRSAARTSSLI